MRTEQTRAAGPSQEAEANGPQVRCWGCQEGVPASTRAWVADVPASARGFYCPRCTDEVRGRFTRLCPRCRQPFRLRHVGMMCCDSCRPRDRSREPQRVETHLHRAQALGLPATLTLAQWLATLAYFQGMCAYCSEHPAETLDHVVELARGGGTTQENCVPACLPCNLRIRGDKTRLDQIRRFRDHLKRRAPA